MPEKLNSKTIKEVIQNMHTIKTIDEFLKDLQEEEKELEVPSSGVFEAFGFEEVNEKKELFLKTYWRPHDLVGVPKGYYDPLCVWAGDMLPVKGKVEDGGPDSRNVIKNFLDFIKAADKNKCENWIYENNFQLGEDDANEEAEAEDELETNQIFLDTNLNFMIRFDLMEWQKILEFKSKCSRPKLLVGASRYFLDMFKEKNINCELKFISNYFTTSQKENSDGVFVNVSWNRKTCNEKLTYKRIIISGDKRKTIKNEVCSKGITNFRTDALNSNDGLRTSILYNTIRKMKREFNHRYQLNNEFSVDSDASKLIFDLIIEQQKKKAFMVLCMIFNLIHLVSYYCLKFNVNEALKEQWGFKKPYKKNEANYHEPTDLSIIQTDLELNRIFNENLNFESKMEVETELESKQERDTKNSESELIEIDDDKFESKYSKSVDCSNFFYYCIDNYRILNKAVEIIDSFHLTELIEKGKLPMKKYTFEKCEYVIGLINEYGNHWTCLIIDITKDEVIYIDPLGETEAKSNKVLESWITNSKCDSFVENENGSDNENKSKDELNNESKDNIIVKTCVISSSLKSDLVESQLVKIDDGQKKCIKVKESPKECRQFFDQKNLDEIFQSSTLLLDGNFAEKQNASHMNHYNDDMEVDTVCIINELLKEKTANSSRLINECNGKGNIRRGLSSHFVIKNCRKMSLKKKMRIWIMRSPEISLKLEIKEDYNNKVTPTELSRKYGLAASTISTIVKNQEAIKKAPESMRDIKKAKRLREPEYKEFEKYLDMWFRDTKAHNSITLDGPLI
ncbi:hypothetical protein BpHYR1_018050 [Brachionus plicatilis]|uniref:Ubiquitin-like protease family profile domain-containing protein n=1 Tax=Brachionus plicatilis TaxID=10195 RepID=A0A3M7R097_BRAPC|nr:hypothetical protein BpHYR1_018050 [Brachionus plicatilis]